MLLKRIEAKSLPDAIKRVRAECGDDALVLEASQPGGTLALRGRECGYSHGPDAVYGAGIRRRSS